MSGLYDGLLELGSSKKEDEQQKAKPKEVPAHVLLMRKRAATTSSSSTSVPPVKQVIVAAPAIPVGPASAAVEDPYDPSCPNSYEKIRGLRDVEAKKQKKKLPSIGKDLLLKAGWKDGQRLGKHGQGISRPLDPIRLGFYLTSKKNGASLFCL
jgi:hypothetical protein